MRGLIFQDVFSNLLLAVLVLLLVTVRLVGSAEPALPVVGACRVTPSATGTDVAVALRDVGGRAELAWLRRSGEAAPASSDPLFVSVLREGCAVACRRCDAGEAVDLPTAGSALAIRSCRPAECDEAPG